MWSTLSCSGVEGDHSSDNRVLSVVKEVKESPSHPPSVVGCGCGPTGSP